MLFQAHRNGRFSELLSNTSGKLSWLPGVAAMLALVACNGTVILVGILAVFGVNITINPHVQAMLVSLFAITCLFFVFKGFKAQQKAGPLILAVIGSMLVVGSMYIYFNKIVESIGLVLLIGSTIWNWLQCRNKKAS